MRRRTVGKMTRYEILKKQKFRCAICGVHLKYSRYSNLGDVVAHIDHIHPISKKDSYEGYIESMSNLQALCPTCNIKKGNKIPKKCPNCNHQLEIGSFNLDPAWKDIEDKYHVKYDPNDWERIYICNNCGDFFPEDAFDK